jgi:hypothetical protein
LEYKTVKFGNINFNGNSYAGFPTDAHGKDRKKVLKVFTDK